MARRKRASGRNKGKGATTRQSPSKAVPEPTESDEEVNTQPESEGEVPAEAADVPETEEGQEEPLPVAETDQPADVEPTAEEEGKAEGDEEEVVAATGSSSPGHGDTPAAPPPKEENPSTSADGDGKDNGVELEYPLLSYKELLVDPKLGFGPIENLKEPLKCFSPEDEITLFPMIETMSAELFNIVQQLNAAQKKDIEVAIKKRKGVLKIPNPLVKAYLCQVKHMEQPSEKSSSSKRTPHPFLLTEDENMFTEEKLKMLRAVLDAGWKREVVMRSPGSTGRKTGDVYYYSPDGTKFRSSKQVAQHLTELQDTPFTIENFSFAKVRISTNPDQEIVRKAYDGKPPPRVPAKSAPSRGKQTTPPKAESSSSSKPGPKPSTSRDSAEMESRTEEPVKGVSSRRSIQPPKRYSGDAVVLLSKRPKVQDDKNRSSNSKGLQMGMLPPKYPKGKEETLNNLSDSMDYMETGSNHDEGSGSTSVAMREIAEDSLFQISALRQSGSIDVDKMHRYVENQKKKSLIPAGRPQQPRPVPGSSKGGPGIVIPCSIRCPGMLGVIPNLQCTNCLCLFHAECLGLPPNLMFSKKYLCSNCTDQGATPTTVVAGTSNAQRPMVKKPSEMRRGPPGLAPLPHGHPRGPVPGRDITVTLAGREREHVPVRMPQKVITVPAGMARGVVRTRGGTMGHQVHQGHQGHPVRSVPGQGQRVVTADGTVTMVGGNVHMMRRGRGRPPAAPPSRSHPPQMSRNLTITQLPRIQGPLPVPNLQPMMTPKALPNKLPLPVGGGKPRQAIAVPNLMKSNAFRVAVPPPSLSGRTFKKAPPISQPTPTNLRLSHPAGANRSAPVAYTTVTDRSIPLVKRSPQTVCMIGNKKFVVLPKNKKPKDFISANMTMGNGGLAKGTYTITEARGTPEPNLKKINHDSVTVTEHMSGNSENAKNETSVNDDGALIGDEMLSYDDNEEDNSQNSQQGNGDVEDNGMDTSNLTDVAVAGAE